MNLDTQIIDTLKWFSIGIGWLISTYITYRIGRQTKHDDIQIAKRHTFAEQLSVLLQKDFNNRELIVQQYHSNFDHMKDLSEAISVFNKYESLYLDIRQLMSELPTDIGKLQETNRSAAIYIDEGIIKSINSYIANTSFSYETDGGLGLFNTYAENFFITLLDTERSKSLAQNYKAAMRGLRKAVR